MYSRGADINSANVLKIDVFVLSITANVDLAVALCDRDLQFKDPKALVAVTKLSIDKSL